MKKFWIIFVIILGFICGNIFSISFGKEEMEVQNTDYMIGTVTAEALKLRAGIGLDATYIGLLSKGDTLYVYGKYNDWYIVKTQDNLVGGVFADYVEISYENQSTIETSSNIESAENLSFLQLSQDEQIFYNLINNKRLENNLPEFELDENLLNIARLKANDIEKNNYFSHTSPTYGSFFEMLTNNNVSYSKASENIARNINADSAIESFMKSESHKNNILSNEFNYTGIAVVNSLKGDKIFIEIFISR